MVSSINPLGRRYRFARLRLDVPRDSKLLADSGQAHADATARGTLQHLVLEKAGALISVGPPALDIVVSCAEDGGTFTSTLAREAAETGAVQRAHFSGRHESLRGKAA